MIVSRFIKKSLIKTLVFVSAAWLGATSITYAQAPIELEVGNWVASAGSLSVNAMDPWKKLVEEKTNGRVYHAGIGIPAYYYDTA